MVKLIQAPRGIFFEFSVVIYGCNITTATMVYPGAECSREREINMTKERARRSNE